MPPQNQPEDALNGNRLCQTELEDAIHAVLPAFAVDATPDPPISTLFGRVLVLRVRCSLQLCHGQFEIATLKLGAGGSCLQVLAFDRSGSKLRFQFLQPSVE